MIQYLLYIQITESHTFLLLSCTVYYIDSDSLKGLHGFTVYSFEIDIKMIRNSNYSLIGVGYRIKKTINTKRFCFVSVCFFLFFFCFLFFVCFLFTMNLDVVMIYFPLFVKVVLIYFLIILFCFIKRI